MGKKQKTRKRRTVNTPQRKKTQTPTPTPTHRVNEVSVKKAKARRRKRRNRLYRRFMSFIITLALLACVGGVVYFRYLNEGRPELILEKLNDNMQVSYVYDRDGNEIAMLTGPEKRINLSYNQIPKQLIDAFISIEDKRFYEHHGIDLKGTMNAVFGELTGGAKRGGSTITQQLIKNVYLTSERTYRRKAQEMVMAYELEKTLTKNEILTYYMNEIFLGEDNYGVEAAALDYFGKHVGDLTLKECAGIAGMTSFPNGYNPRTDYEAFNKRANIVLYAMYTDGKITSAQYNEAKEERPVITDGYFDKGIYPYTAFVDYAIKTVAEDMIKADKKEVNPNNLKIYELKVRTGGYKIHTTLDSKKQDALQQIAANYPYLTAGVEVSADIIDHSTGEIYAMIPGREENNVMDGFNRAVDSRQAIGSTAKPIFVYAPYIDMGADTDTIVDDRRIPIKGWNTAQGYPNGEITDRMITLRYAVETSRNIAAARTLMDNVGIENSYDYLVKMGVDGSHTTKSPSGMGLGSDGYTTLEIAGAYATLANDGVYIEPHAYTKITDLEDNEVFEKKPDSHRVFSSEAAWMMTDVLQTTMTRGYGVNARLPGITCAGKTGTHEDKVVTMAGYTHYYTCFLRISMDDDSPIKETSYANSSVLWKQMMSEMHTGLPDAPIQKKSFDDLNIVWYGGEYRHWTNNYYSKYIQPAPAEYQPTEHEVCDEYGNCWVETW